MKEKPKHPEKRASTKAENKAGPVSSQTYYLAAAIVAVIAIVVVASIALGGQNSPAAQPAGSNTFLPGNNYGPTQAPQPTLYNTQPSQPPNILSVPTSTPTTLNQWRPNTLRCYATSDCFISSDYCQSRFSTHDQGVQIQAGQQCVCLSQSCQVV
jgi:hypothetical protein